MKYVNEVHTCVVKGVTEDIPARLDLAISRFGTGLMADLTQIYPAPGLCRSVHTYNRGFF